MSPAVVDQYREWRTIDDFDLADMILQSAGSGALVSLDTRLALREDGIHIDEDMTSTDLKRHPELLNGADLVLAMTEEQARNLMEKFPSAVGRAVHTLRSFAGERGDIEDPYEKGDQVFAACREEIKRLVPVIIDRLFEG